MWKHELVRGLVPQLMDNSQISIHNKLDKKGEVKFMSGTFSQKNYERN